MSNKHECYVSPNRTAKYKQKLNDEIMALIYFYPTGISRTSKGYCFSGIGLKGADIFDERHLRVTWKCNGLKKRTKIKIKKYAQFEDKMLGLDDLFKTDKIGKSKYVKIILEII